MVVIAVILLLGLASGVWGYFQGLSSLPAPVAGVTETQVTPLDEVVQISTTSTPAPNDVKIRAEVFEGLLEKVDTGCFSDGECFVTVGGKHVTTLTGMRIDPQPVGSVKGVKGFGELLSHLGSFIEVYAQGLPDGTYTLYGSEGFYIKLLGGSTASSTTSGTASCVVGGCSSQLCVDASQGEVVSTCEYKEEYACYAGAVCGRQANGQCGWTETKELTQCLSREVTGQSQIQVN